MNPCKIKTLESPFIVFNEQKIHDASRLFLNNFNGKTMYAVKANNFNHVIQTIWNSGIKDFDIASIGELIKIKKLYPQANCYFMNPIKSVQAIVESYKMGCRVFVADYQDEVGKIYHSLKDHCHVKDTEFNTIRIVVRMEIDGDDSVVNLNVKFGCKQQNMCRILNYVKELNFQTGISFHVGSQCVTVSPYIKAMKMTKQVIEQFPVDFLDVGGGFPIDYNGKHQFDLLDYFKVLNKGIDELPVKPKHIFCEPGRAVVAESQVLIVQVIARDRQNVFINDGIYGSLMDVKLTGWQFNYQSISMQNKLSDHKTKYTVYGPTCDGIDAFPDKMSLPKNLAVGDFIAFENTGAYTNVLATQFNDFGTQHIIKGSSDYTQALKEYILSN